MPRHLRWERAGRTLEWSETQRAYVANIGQKNIELADGSFAPYVWSEDAHILRYYDVEAFFVGDSVEFRRGGKRQAKTRLWVERRVRGAWIPEPTQSRIEKLGDEDEFGAVASARIAITLRSPNVTASHILVAGGRYRARGDTELSIHRAGEFRVVLEHDLVRAIAIGSDRFVASNGWRVAWTREESAHRTVDYREGRLRIDLPSVRRSRKQRETPRQWTSPDTYGPTNILATDDDTQSADSSYWAPPAYYPRGVYTFYGSPAAAVDTFAIASDDTTDGSSENINVGLWFGSINLGGVPASIDAGTKLTLARDQCVSGGAPADATVRFRCQATNTPVTGAAGDGDPGRPYQRVYKTAYSEHVFPGNLVTQEPALLDAIGTLTAGNYSYTGSVEHAIMILGGSSVQWGLPGYSNLGMSFGHDLAHATGAEASLTIVYTPPAATVQTTASGPAVSRTAQIFDHQTGSWFNDDPPFELDEALTSFTGTGSGASSALAASAVAMLAFLAGASAVTAPLAGSGVGEETFLATASAAPAPLVGSGAGSETFLASGAVDLASLVATSTAVATFASTGSAAAAPPAAIATTIETFEASAAGSLAPLAATSTATETFLSTSSASIAPAAADATTTLSFLAAGTGALAPLVGSATAEELFLATGSAAPAPLAASANAEETFLCTASAAVAPLASAATAETGFYATGSGAIAPLAGAANGLQSFLASGSAAAAPLAAAATVEETFSTTGTAALAPLAATTTGDLSFLATGSGGLAPLAGSGQAEESFLATGAGACAPFTSTSDSRESFLATGSGLLAPLTADATAAVTFTSTATAACAPLKATAIAIETFEASGSGGFAPLDALATGRETFEGSGSTATSSLAGIGSASETFAATGSAACVLSASASASQFFVATGAGAPAPFGATSLGWFNVYITPGEFAWRIAPATLFMVTFDPTTELSILPIEPATRLVVTPIEPGTQLDVTIAQAVEFIVTFPIRPVTEFGMEIRDMLNVNDIAEINLQLKVHGTLTAPSAGITIKVQSPTQKLTAVWTTYAIGANLLNLGTGLFQALIPCTESGTWAFIWTSPGPIAQGAEVGYFDVVQNPF